jgi:hypothetical protein
MLGFCNDMVNSYGKDMNALIDREFFEKLINTLKTFKNKKYEVEINQLEQVIIANIRY